MTEVVRHDPIDIAARAAEAVTAARNGIVFFKVPDPAEPAHAVMYEIRSDGSARILNDGCEAVIEDGMITGYRILATSR